MVWYKYKQFLAEAALSDFDKLYGPGVIAAYSGIYRCDGCGREVVSTTTHPLPPQNHHQHSVAQGQIRWRLIVTDQPI